MASWNPKDWVTLVLLIGALILRGLGINSVTEYIIIAIAVTYLGLPVVRTQLKARRQAKLGSTNKTP